MAAMLAQQRFGPSQHHIFDIPDQSLLIFVLIFFQMVV
jgi:hypothetical protein